MKRLHQKLSHKADICCTRTKTRGNWRRFAANRPRAKVSASLWKKPGETIKVDTTRKQGGVKKMTDRKPSYPRRDLTPAEEAQRDELFRQLGEAYYEGAFEDPLPQLLPLFDKLTELMKEPEKIVILCPNCGAEVEEGATFCEECGYRLIQPAPEVAQPARPRVQHCPNCGNELGPDANFCGKCGTRIR